jgi:hypothetical protein
LKEVGKILALGYSSWRDLNDCSCPSPIGSFGKLGSEISYIKILEIRLYPREEIVNNTELLMKVGRNPASGLSQSYRPDLNDCPLLPL